MRTLHFFYSVSISHPSQKIKFLMVIFGGSSYVVEISPLKGGKCSIYLIAIFFWIFGGCMVEDHFFPML